jgi:DNA-binding response OmpR family regulator
MSPCAEVLVGSILVAERDPKAGQRLAEQLTADGFRVLRARTVEHARSLVAAGDVQLAIIGGLESPGASLGLLAEIRGEGRAPWAGSSRWSSSLPVIVVSADAQEADLLRAFNAGADDFLARPARYLELRARLRAVLRRASQESEERSLITVGSLQIDTLAHKVSVHGREVSLRRLEYELLVHMAGSPARVFEKQELLQAIWGYRCPGTTRTLDSHASRLRRKLGGDGESWVLNTRGVGYRLI